MKKATLLFVISFLLMNCNVKEENENSESQQVELKYIKDINLELDTKTRNWSTSNQYVFDSKSGKEFICVFNGPTNAIDFYDLSGTKFKSVQFPNEGPNSAGIIHSFLYLNSDSIYLVNNMTNKLFLASSSTKINKTYPLKGFSDSEFTCRPWPEDGSEMYLSNNHLYIPSIPWYRYDKKPDEYFGKGQLSIDLDLKTGRAEEKIGFPNKAIFKDKAFPTQTVSARCSANDEDELVYSFAVDHNVYRFGLEGNLRGKHFMGTTKREKNFVALSNRAKLQDAIEEAVHYANHFYYGRLYFDKYRKLYYRFVKNGLATEYTKKDFNLGKNPGFKFSLIIADKDFKPLGEIDLKKGVGSGSFIITKKGVMIQAEEPNEDVMKFEFYEIKTQNKT